MPNATSPSSFPPLPLCAHHWAKHLTLPPPRCSGCSRPLAERRCVTEIILVLSHRDKGTVQPGPLVRNVAEVGYYGSTEGADAPFISLIINLTCPNKMAGPLGTTCHKWLQPSKVVLGDLVKVMLMPLGAFLFFFHELLEAWICRCETDFVKTHDHIC